ncbi:MAG: DUF2628 domain-containing protein [Rickettsiaceae bacterium]
MNIYCIYTDSSKNHNEVLIVKQGFNFYAAIFTLLWALYHRMWWLVLLAAPISVFTYSVAELQFQYLLETYILLAFGCFASDIQEYYATQNGFSLVDIIVAKNEEEAELKHYYNNAKQEEALYVQ